MPARERVEAFLRSIGLPACIEENRVEEPYSFEEIRQRWGSEERGIEFVDRTEEYEMGSRGVARNRTFALQSYGGADSWFQARISETWVSWTCSDLQISEAFEALVGPDVDPKDPRRLDTLASDAAQAIRCGNWGAAKRSASELLQFRPDDIEATFALGLAYAALDEYSLAEDLLRKVLTAIPTHVDALYCMGNLRIEQKSYLSAEEHLRKVVALDPRNHPAWARLGFTLESMGRRREAIPAYRNALETSPNPGGCFGYTGLDFTSEVLEALERLKAIS